MMLILQHLNQCIMKNGNVLLLAFAMLAVVAFSACPSPGAGNGGGTDTTHVDTVPPVPVHDYGAAVITLERSTCFGRCPSYTLRIEGNGNVNYEGRDFVAVQGVQTAQITPDAVKSLADAFFKIDYFALQDSFDGDITDIPHAITSFSIDGKTKRIYNRMGGPDGLKALETKIDSVAGASKWVNAPEQ